MQRSLDTFPLHRILFSKLSNAGYAVVGDIIDFKACELSRELDISSDEALSLLQLVKASLRKESEPSFYSQERSKTVFQILQQEKLSIVTFSKSLDELFDGGIQIGKITEICGCSGIGKTQLCFQLAVDVQIPQSCGGLDGEAIFIDTEGSFMVERVTEIAKATVLHCHSSFSLDSSCFPLDDDDEALDGFHVKGILSRIHYFRCFDYIQLIALMYTLEEFLKNKNVKLIIIDSIAHIFRQDFDDFQLRTRLLGTVSQSLNKFCTDYQLAVVLTNHMTTKFGSGSNSNLVPALGEAWGHSCTYRVVLHWVGMVRHALLYKSPSKRDLSVPYQVTMAGIRDHVEN